MKMPVCWTFAFLGLTAFCGSVAADALPMMSSAPPAPQNAAAAPAGPVVATASLMMFPQFMAGDFFARNWMKTVPHRLDFSDTAPAGITKEPKYKGKPLYGIMHFGDDSANHGTFVVLDDDAKRVYIDQNQDGDLTDDNAWPWEKVTKNGDKISFESTFTVPANWKTGPGKYGIRMYRPKGSMTAWWQTVGDPTGFITLDGKPYAAFLSDPAGQGIYNLVENKNTLGTEIFIDTDGDGFWRPMGHQEDTGIGRPIKVGANWYDFNVSADGRTLTASAAEAPPESKLPPIVMKGPGDVAPNFEMVLPDGSKAHLADYKGRVVVVDFWATWCGPCQASLPDVQKTWASLDGQNSKISFIGLCVSDAKPAFDKWIQTKGPKFSFTMGYDPAGNTPNKGECHVYGVSGIPSTFIIGPDGKIIDSFSGYSPENEARFAQILNKLGITSHGKSLVVPAVTDQG